MAETRAESQLIQNLLERSGQVTFVNFDTTEARYSISKAQATHMIKMHMISKAMI